MSNELGMAMQQAILALKARGWSHRRIAREMGIHRETVGRYLSLAEKLEAQKAIRELEEARKKKRHDFFQSQDAIDANRDTLIADMEKQLQRQHQCNPLLAIHWSITTP